MRLKVNQETIGWGWAALGVLCFSFTLPATRLAAPEFGGLLLGFGRDFIAGLLALALLWFKKEHLPQRKNWLGLGLVALGVVFGFPLFTSVALQTVPSNHGAVVVGLLPAATAVAAVIFAKEHPRPIFWVICGLGVLAVFGFAISNGAGQIHTGDIYMFIAIVLAAIGYAEGGRLSREMDGWRVISWALVFSLPVVTLALFILPYPVQFPSVSACLGFVYVSVVSMFLGFFAWYRGLALGGVARAGQTQLMQPVLTVLWSGILLGEYISIQTIIASGVVIACALLSRLTR